MSAASDDSSSSVFGGGPTRAGERSGAGDAGGGDSSRLDLSAGAAGRPLTDASRRSGEAPATESAGASGESAAIAEAAALTREVPRDSPACVVGQRIGSYTVLGTIGEGGMGAVYRAQQDRPRQLVALKLIRSRLAGERELRRFEFEAEVLGHLQHPGIARIYQAGTFDGAYGPQPYFAMELIDGAPLTTYAQQAGLGSRQRLELLAKVADAVQHAHSSGVVHLDLKPANILVARDGQPKVVDFGVAKLAPGEPPRQTLAALHSTSIGGTPAYMSPEQAGGDPRAIDARSDVYSLGVVAYQLLTGRLPYAGLSRPGAQLGMYEVLRMVREEEPTRLAHAARWDGSSGRVFAGDVEAIVGKALEKDRTRRYQTAAALAADIRRHPNDEPITARRPSTWYQFAKFAKRNRFLVGGVAATILALLAGLIGTIGMLGRALAAEAGERGARQKTSEALVRERRQTELARESAAAEAKARRRSEAISQFVVKALRASDPSEGGKQDTTIAEAMSRARQEIEAGAFKDDPETEVELESTIALILLNNGHARDAEPMFQDVLEMVRDVFPGEPQHEAAALGNLALCASELGRREEAERMYEQAFDLHKRLSMNDDPRVAASLNDWAASLIYVGRFAEALQQATASLDMYERLFAGDHPDKARSLNTVASCLESLGRSAEALPKYEAVLAMRLRLFPGDRPEVATGMNNVAAGLCSLGRLDEALPRYEAALEMFQRMYHGDHSAVATGLSNVAGCLRSLGRADEALPRYRAALAMRQRLFPGDHPDVASALNNLALCLHSMNRPGEALPEFEAARDMFRRLIDGDDPGLAAATNNVGLCLEALGRRSEALPMYEATLEMHQRLFPDDHPHVANSLNNVASCLRSLGRIDEAVPKYQASMDIYDRVLPAGHPQMLFPQLGLARALIRLDRYAESEALLLDAAAQCERSGPCRRTHGTSVLRVAVELYEAWHAAEPAGGYDAKVAEWRARLDEWRASTQPAAPP
jgi:non-specific serine/threonine protein kinase/serine/threonine-protein kinase